MYDNFTLTTSICPLCGEFLIEDENKNRECNSSECAFRYYSPNIEE